MTLPDRSAHRISTLASFLALALSLAAAPARAADPRPSPAPATAEKLADDAYQLHVSGKEAEAIATYLQAYELSKAGAILFNVATIYDRALGERGLAEDFFRRYLVAPDAEPDLVRKATERLTALKKQDEDEAATKRATIPVAPVSPAALAAPAAPAATPPAPAATEAKPEQGPPRSSGSTMRTAGIVVGAVGVAGVGAGMVLGLMAKAKNDDANAVCNGAACSSQNGVSLASQAGSLATASTLSVIAGLAFVGGGITMVLLAPRDAAPSQGARITVSPQVGLSRAGVTLGGTF